MGNLSNNDTAFSSERRAALSAIAKYGASVAGALLIVLSASEAVKAQGNSNANCPPTSQNPSCL